MIRNPRLPLIVLPLALLIAAPLFVMALPAAEAAPPVGGAQELLGRGVQIYTCADTPSGIAWTFKAPQARLLDAAGHVVGNHFAGPAWQAMDGSKVVATPVVVSSAPETGAIPWLVLRVTEHDGAGRFANTSYITRTRTKGGVAPASGCDASHSGAEARVPYGATYTFFAPPAS